MTEALRQIIVADDGDQLHGYTKHSMNYPHDTLQNIYQCNEMNCFTFTALDYESLEGALPLLQ